MLHQPDLTVIQRAYWNVKEYLASWLSEISQATGHLEGVFKQTEPSWIRDGSQVTATFFWRDFERILSVINLITSSKHLVALFFMTFSVSNRPSPFHTELPYYHRSVVHSHRAKQLRREDAPVCNSYSKPALWVQRGLTAHVMMLTSVGVFSRYYPRCPPVDLNVYPLTVCNHTAAVRCCDWDPDPPNILERDKVMFFPLNDIIK